MHVQRNSYNNFIYVYKIIVYTNLSVNKLVVVIVENLNLNLFT